ncbi:MAG: methylated-DNA--[protein]-cysteine S-methyltransferase [Gemmatimonadota bacterium]
MNDADSASGSGSASGSLRLDTLLGWMELRASAQGITELRFQERMVGEPRTSSPAGPEGSQAHLEMAAAFLKAYFDGHVSSFASLPMDLTGATPYHARVWAALRRILPGEVRTYGDLTRELGEGSPRALGQAVGANPIPILIPCHRVVRMDGTLGGYSGGLRRKAFLLRHEGVDVSGEREDSRVVPGGLNLGL